MPFAWQCSQWQDTAFRLAAGVRIRKGVTDPRQENRAVWVLLAPEKCFFLELSEAAILEFCQGEISFPQMVELLGQFFEEEIEDTFAASISEYLEDLIAQRLLVPGTAVNRARTGGDYFLKLRQISAEYDAPPAEATSDLPTPRGLIAELTYRCPLHCPYCSNPTELSLSARELATGDWVRAIKEASALGVLHVGFSGGEPLIRKDLPELVGAARSAGLYTNLLTSAVGLTPEKAGQLRDAGLDSMQISFQADEEGPANEIAGRPAHAAKLAAARTVIELGFPLTLNVVIHRKNIDRIGNIIGFAESLGARQLELANVQFYGWAMENRAQLLPTRSQVRQAEVIAAAAQERLRGKMEVIYVAPDYFGTTPKPCMHGWGLSNTSR